MIEPSAESGRLSPALRERVAAYPLRQQEGRPETLSAFDPLWHLLPLDPDQAEALAGTQSILSTLLKQCPKLRETLHAAEEAAVAAITPSGTATQVPLPAGWVELVSPVVHEEQIIGLLWSGCFRRHDISEADLKTNTQKYDFTAEPLENWLRLPAWSDSDIEREQRRLSAWAATLAVAWAETQRASEMANELHSSERTRALGTLSSGIAHHFNNLLSVILGYSSHLLNRLELSDEAHAALLHISEAAQKGRRMTEEVLGFVGSATEEKAICSVHQMIQGLCPLLESQAAGRFRFMCHLDAIEDHVNTQRSALHQTIYNLLTNFRDEHAATGGDLHVSTRNLQRREAGQLVNYVQIRVARSADPGSDDEVEMMLALNAEPVAEVVPARPPRKLASHEIWVVDDDPIFCEMCVRVLGDDGHRVTSIPSGPALQEAYKTNAATPTLLIIDFSMPDSNGLELRTWLRSEGCRAPVILVSGFSNTHPDIQKALRMRKTYFLQKPFPVPELADIVSVALGETLLGV